MLQYLVVDVDGTMTDGGIYYDQNGNEWKKFCTKDAAGFFVAKQVGIQIVVITGRECVATEKRARELKVECLYQNIKDKKTFLKLFMEEKNIYKEQIGYIGDDLNDLPAMMQVGFVGCPADSCREVKEIADYVSKIRGGSGAVRDIIEFLLRENGVWDSAAKAVYGGGI